MYLGRVVDIFVKEQNLPARIFHERQSDHTVRWLCSVNCASHGFVLEDPLLPVSERCAVPPLVLELSSFQGGTGKVLSDCLDHARGDHHVNRSQHPASPNQPVPGHRSDRVLAPLPDLQLLVDRRSTVLVSRGPRASQRVSEEGKEA